MSHDARAPDPSTADASAESTEWDRLRLITQPTRAALLSDILGHPKESPSVREFDYRNPDVKRSTIEYHLQELVEAGVVEKITLPAGERKRDLPSTFYGLTDEGYDLLERHGLLEEQPVWKAVDERLEKPPEIRAAEELDRHADGA
ncbi:winged helix-turn-helix domain-containing protein [Natronosalvus rutilus]|uniref:Helix-turn-helix domain-containing protein n=1 Tax=Natronosalvus rutilus TaxID=2953753 RepID=A0A9E7SUY7_9EURY|nr:helix-turn-helix domain-containing protein [Natronosalvus rutilus]UTF53352.1 helix-turn-helix domain-containing protein [Natronosalvus rutilus]